MWTRMSLLIIGANSAAEVRKLYRGRACAVVDSARVLNDAGREGGVPRSNRKSNGQFDVTGFVTMLSNTNGSNRVAVLMIHT